MIIKKYFLNESGNIYFHFVLRMFIALAISIFITNNFNTKVDLIVLDIDKQIEQYVYNTPYESLDTKKIDDNLGIDVVILDETHKQVFVLSKLLPHYDYQFIVTKNSEDGSILIRPFIKEVNY